MTSRRGNLIAALLLAVVWMPPAAAADALPAAIGFDPPIGEPVPPDVRLADESGTLLELLRGHRRTVLVPVWYHCRKLCDLTLESLARGVPAAAPASTQVLVYSIDPDETAADAAGARRALLERHPRLSAGASWRFAVLSPPAIDRLSRAIGFRFDFDAGHQQFRHVAGAVVLDDRGLQRAFLPGPAIRPEELERALGEAEPPPIARLAAFCFTYDPETGRYSFSILRAVRWLGLLTVLVIAVLAYRAIRRERKREGTSG